MLLWGYDCVLVTIVIMHEEQIIPSKIINYSVYSSRLLEIALFRLYLLKVSSLCIYVQLRSCRSFRLV